MPQISQGEAQNKLSAPNTPNYSRFPIHKHIYTTMRFGENQVIGVFNAVEGDQIEWRCAHELQSYTLKAPLMTPIHMEKDYFQVPRMAILPFNWDKIHRQPSIGDDVDASVCGTSVKASSWKAFLDRINIKIQQANEGIENASGSTEEVREDIYIGVTEFFKTAIVAEYIYSYGSLLNCLGCKMAAIWKHLPIEGLKQYFRRNFDTAFENFISKFTYGMDVYWDSDNGKHYTVVVNLEEEFGGNRITMHEFLTRLRDQPEDFHVDQIYKSETGTEIETKDDVTEIRRSAYMLQNNNTEYSRPVDLARVWAYQLVNAEYFTNDKVDYIYSAELYRQYIGDISGATGERASTFEWNGNNMPYDYLSAYYFVDNNTLSLNYTYLAALFAYRRSLKYLDYFTGSKTRPLAVGDVTIPVEGGQVSVINVTQSIQKQRFLNAVNRIKGNAEEYVEQLMGIKVDKDWHNPKWLGSTREAIKTSQTENTGDAQLERENSITSHFEGYGGNYKFTFNIDRDSIIIGLCFFDIERNYAKGTHRSFMHVDRYDMYNSYLQYCGDQEIMGAEYDTALDCGGETLHFGYVPAYEEFKQEINEAQAGFVTALPGYTFIDGMEKDNALFRPEAENVSPDFIRSKPVELDRYYNSLTGNSLANYFHFIVDIYNDMSAKRKMAFNPQIL